MKALRNDDFDSYWTQTSAAESLMEYISLDYDGLSKTIAELIGGIEVGVDTSGFSNDLVTFREKDDVLTLLIHLGYLAYDKETEKVHIPNEEIKREFSRTIRGVRRNETIQRVRESDQIISDTVHCEFFVCFALKQKRSRKNLPNSLILRAFCLIFSWKCGTVLV